MRVQVAGRQMDVGEALRSRIEGELTTGVAKYFNRATDAVVTVARDGGNGVEVDCAIHLSSGISLQTQGYGGDAHSAFGDALTKLEKRVRRYKRRLRNHHANDKTGLSGTDLEAYVLAPPEEDTTVLNGKGEAAVDAPLVIAEAVGPVKTMTVSMAALELGLSEGPVVVFRNAAHDGINVLYRRSDGNVGWIDPARGNSRPDGRTD